MNKIIQLYSDKNKTIKAYPKTLASQVYMDDGQTTITSQLESIEQLKVDKGQVKITDINKNFGLIDETYLSDSLKAQISGTAPINPVLEDKSITPNKTTFIATVGKNKINLDKIIEGKYIVSSGTINNAGDKGYCVTDYIDISTLKSFSIINGTFYANIYDGNKVLLRTVYGADNPKYTKNNDEAFIVITLYRGNNAMLVDGEETNMAYEDYKITINKEFLGDKSISENNLDTNLKDVINSVKLQESSIINILKINTITNKWDTGNITQSITQQTNGTLLNFSSNDTAGAIRFISKIDNDNIKNNNYYFLDYEVISASGSIIANIPFITSSDDVKIDFTLSNKLIKVTNNTSNEFSIYFDVPPKSNYSILIKKMYIVSFDTTFLSSEIVKKMLSKNSNNNTSIKVLISPVSSTSDFAKVSDISNSTKSINIGKNKKELFLGDSITAEARNQKGWVFWYRQVMKPSSYTNIAVPSASWKDKTDTVLDGNPTSSVLSNNTLCNQVQKVINNFNSNTSEYLGVQRIHIACGVNDGGVNEQDKNIESQFTIDSNTNLPLESVDRKTFGGAMRWAIDKLRALYPNAQIYIYLPIQVGTGRANYQSLKELRNIMISICDRLAIKYIDSNYCGIYSHYETTIPYLDTEDKIHPNVQGAKKQGLFNANAVLKENLIDYTLY